jgi:hypothetical protein
MITESDLQEEEEKAWKALKGYKFWMFGYHAANWVNFNRKGGFKKPNPFKSLITFADQKLSETLHDH